MSGPFPGMDPYLENPLIWQGTHNALITLMRGALNAVLPAPYVAGSEVRCYIERPSEIIRPDVFIKRAAQPENRAESGGVALAQPYSPSVEFTIHPLEQQEAYLDIVNVADNRRVVTSIELLSHTNKTTQNEGRELYLAKQRKVLDSSANLIEIDLLRSGLHTVAIPQSAFQPEHRYDYLVCLHRAAREGHFEVWMNSLRERLPLIRVPLEAEVADVPLDLQAVFDRNYEEGAYAQQVDYRQAPVPPLTGDDASWADALLHEKGLR